MARPQCDIPLVFFILEVINQEEETMPNDYGRELNGDNFICKKSLN
jgi:hypothetical protein